MTRRPVPLLLAAMVCLSAVSARGQDAQATDPPAHISLVDGGAVLERDGRTDSAPSSMPLLAGDRIRTQGGRVEVLFADSSALHLDSNTVIDLQSDDVVRLLEGTIRLSIAGPAREVSYRIDAPAAWVQINDPGEYRIGVIRGEDVELGVLRGSAELVNEQGRSYIRAGERTFARAGSAPSAPYVYNSASWDAFDRWSEARRDQRLGVSAQYLPNDVRPYSAAFDSYGDWRYQQQYGYVWYPRVSVGWRPYHYGRWASLRPYGWTWIAGDPWGWPTHHYGRWGISAGSWFWIPGRVWGPAWVSWAYATNYVSWCPLGWNNRPVLHIVNANYFGGRRYDPWYAWTAVPRRHFNGPYFNVSTVAVGRIDPRIHSTFVVGDRAPDARFAAGRSAEPIRTAGRYAVPRSGVAAASDIAAGRNAAGVNGGGERRFPAPSRQPRTPSAVQREAGTPSAAPGNARAVARERSPGVPADESRATSAMPSAGIGDRESRRAPDVARSRGSDAAPVTSAPNGAVRAVPRQPEAARPDTSARWGVRPERSRTDSAGPGPGTAPSYRAVPSTPRSSSGPGEVDVYRSAPRSRSLPDAGPDYRSRAIPRSENAPAAPQAPTYRQDMPSRQSSPRNDPPQAPSYRSAPAPERRAPSGPPPPSAGPSQPRSGGEGSGGGGRQRSGEGQSSGQARRRS
jgi:Family of unknown function (DUF6600)/FecR protein